MTAEAPATFGEQAVRLAGLTAQTLGWTPSQFWEATPADLALSIQQPTDVAAGLSRSELNLLLESECNG